MKFFRKRRREPEPQAVELVEPVARLVDVYVLDAYVAAVRDRIGSLIVDERRLRDSRFVALTMEFDATSDEIAERMGRRAVERIGIQVLRSSIRDDTEVEQIGARL